MDKLLVIADDFTGALDTGIQFVRMGIQSKIVADYNYDPMRQDSEYPVLSVSVDSRRTDGETAWNRVYTLTRKARDAGYKNIYKKTDSGLRGNIGMELKAVLDACRTNVIVFVPAYPGMNRVTRNGVQYIDQIPVSESVFGKDPYEPVIYSDIAQMIRRQTDLIVKKIPRDDYDSIPDSCQEQTVMLFDAESDEDMIRIARALKRKGFGSVCAGCAGFASVYQEILSMEKGKTDRFRKTRGILALCGSMNPITIEQLDYAAAHGFTRKHLASEKKLKPATSLSQDKQFFDHLFMEISSTDRYILDTLDGPDRTSAEYAADNGIPLPEIRDRIADSLGLIASQMVCRGLDYTFSMTGGDTLSAFMKMIGERELVPVCETGNGAVLSILHYRGRQIQIISKSGGFGELDIFVKMYITPVYMQDDFKEAHSI